MVDFLIKEKTIALKKIDKKTIIYDVDKVRVINKHIKQVLEFNCLFYGSSYIGSRKCAQEILKVKYKVPIPLEINKNIILIQLDSIRNKDCLFLVTNKILDYEYTSSKLKINCLNNYIFYVNISQYSFEKMLINSFKLNNTLKWRKITNIV